MGLRVKYDTKSNYYGLSLGGGHVWNLDANSDLNLYGRYVWTRQAGDSMTIVPSQPGGVGEDLVCLLH